MGKRVWKVERETSSDGVGVATTRVPYPNPQPPGRQENAMTAAAGRPTRGTRRAQLEAAIAEIFDPAPASELGLLAQTVAA